MMRAWTSPDWYWALDPAPAALVKPTMTEPATARELMRTILTVCRLGERWGEGEAAQEAASPRGRTARSIYSTEQQNSSPRRPTARTRGVENAMAAPPRFLAAMAMAKGINMGA